MKLWHIKPISNKQIGFLMAYGFQWYYIILRTLLNRYIASRIIGHIKESEEYKEHLYWQDDECDRW